MAANKSNEAFKQELAPVRQVDRSWVSDCGSLWILGRGCNSRVPPDGGMDKRNVGSV